MSDIKEVEISTVPFAFHVILFIVKSMKNLNDSDISEKKSVLVGLSCC